MMEMGVRIFVTIIPTGSIIPVCNKVALYFERPYVNFTHEAKKLRKQVAEDPQSFGIEFIGKNGKPRRSVPPSYFQWALFSCPKAKTPFMTSPKFPADEYCRLEEEKQHG